MQPFNSIFSSKPTLFAFLSVIPPAISVVFVKKAVIDCDALSFSLFFTFMIGILSLIICLFSNKKNTFASQINLIPKSFFWFSGFLLAINQFTFALASKQIMVANLMALIRISTVFQIIFAYYILNEKTDIKRRLLVSIFIILGFCITSFSENFD